MNDLDSKKCFISSDGASTEGPFSFGELKGQHLARNLQDGTLCSVLDSYGGYELWRPIAHYTRDKKEIGSRTKSIDRMADVLGPYVGWFIGVNVTAPKELDVVRLVRTANDHFSVSPRGDESVFHYPYSQIISAREVRGTIECKILKPIDRTIKQGALSKLFGVDVNYASADWVKVRVEIPLLIEVNKLIVYNGGTMIGVSMPVG